MGLDLPNMAASEAVVVAMFTFGSRWIGVQTMFETTLALLLGAGAYRLWASNMRFREKALRVCHAACRDQQVQLLDQTVALSGWRLCQRPGGGRRVQRIYLFEYSGDGVERGKGRAIFIAGRCECVCFELPTGATIMHSRSG